MTKKEAIDECNKAILDLEAAEEFIQTAGQSYDKVMQKRNHGTSGVFAALRTNLNDWKASVIRFRKEIENEKDEDPFATDIPL